MLWSSFYPLILPEVGGCPEPVVDAQLLRAAVDFCDTTQLWVTSLTAINAVSGTGEYALTSPVSETVVCGISELWYLNERMKFIPVSQMRRYSTHWPSDQGQVIGYTQLAENAVTLYRKPAVSTASAIKINAVIRPSHTATGLADWIGQKHFDTLVAGTKARLMAMVGAPWANPQGSALYAGIYNVAVQSVVAERAGGRSRDRLSSPTGGGEQ